MSAVAETSIGKIHIFTTVNSGDIKRFVRLVIKNLSVNYNSYLKNRKKLSQQFSKIKSYQVF